VTLNEAKTLLNISFIEDAEEAIEIQLFELQKQLISKPILPLLLKARRAKIEQLIKVCEILKLSFPYTNKKLILNNLNNLNLIDCFNNYQKNKNSILTQIATNLSIENLLNSIDLMESNLKQWCRCWPELIDESKDQILLSKELDSMEFLNLLKELSIKNCTHFEDLSNFELPEKLITEIKRLNMIKKMY